MKKTILFALVSFAFVIASAKSVTFSKWEVSAITESTAKSGEVIYSAHYQGVAYILTPEQYNALMNGYDVTLNIEE